MIIPVPKEVRGCDGFLRDYLPRRLMEHACAGLAKGKDAAMNAYLAKLGVSHSVADIASFALGNMDCFDDGDECYLAVSASLKVDGMLLDELCRLIDFGNAEVKGLWIVTDALNYAATAIVRLAEDYMTEI